ncbi:MAG TPA: hypothetical protein DCQ31_15630 [Bacteroidales bacterium]|nr:hypothetical protein [Bacteroidales bacterium]
MNSILIAGTIVVVLALIAYSVGVYIEQTKRRINRYVVFFMSLGIFFDVTATVLMIAGSTNSPFTFHGFLGYSALILMIIEVVLIISFKINNSSDTLVPKKLHKYSLLAYCYWFFVFVTGGLIAAL